MDMPLDLDVVTESGGLAALEPAWTMLESSADCSAFETFAWNRSWWELVGARTGRHRLYLVRLTRDGDCVGIAPFMIEHTHTGRVLRFLGDPWNDYNDVLLADLGTDLRARAVVLIAQHLRDGLGQDWEQMDLSEVPEGSPLFAYPQTAGPAGPHRGESAGRSLQRSLARDQDGVSSPSAVRKIKQLEAKGPVRVRLITDRDELLLTAADFITMHIRQWHGRADAVAPFTEPETLRFYTNSLPSLARASLVGLIELTLGSTPAAYIYGLTRGSSFLSYRTTYEPDLALLSPGTVMHALAFPLLRRHGFTVFDFGRGDYGYKKKLSDRAVDCLRVSLQETA